jgi:hypothetical protein
MTMHCTLRRTLGTETRKISQLKFYKAVVLPTLQHGIESWTTRAKDLNRIYSVQE